MKKLNWISILKNIEIAKKRSIINGLMVCPTYSNKSNIPKLDRAGSRRIEWYIIWLWFGQQLKGFKRFKPHFGLVNN